MKTLFITSGLAGIAALTATVAVAQTYSSAPDAYTQNQRDYQASQEAYRDLV